MSFRTRKFILGIYDLILTLGVLHTGISMIREVGIFADFPVEWLSKTPFENWVLPGIIGILVYGLGNLIAAVFSIISNSSKSWIISMIMGWVLFISMILQIIVLGESFLVTWQLFLLSFLQLGLSKITANGNKNLLRSQSDLS